MGMEANFMVGNFHGTDFAQWSMRANQSEIID